MRRLRCVYYESPCSAATWARFVCPMRCSAPADENAGSGNGGGSSGALAGALLQGGQPGGRLLADASHRTCSLCGGCTPQPPAPATSVHSSRPCSPCPLLVLHLSQYRPSLVAKPSHTCCRRGQAGCHHLLLPGLRHGAAERARVRGAAGDCVCHWRRAGAQRLGSMDEPLCCMLHWLKSHKVCREPEICLLFAPAQSPLMCCYAIATLVLLPLPLLLPATGVQGVHGVAAAVRHPPHAGAVPRLATAQ